MARKIPKIPLKIPQEEALKSALVSTAGALMLAKASPDDALGELFSDVQLRQVYEDGKTFIDLIPKKRMKQIKKEYETAKKDPDFNLHEFVKRHFYAYEHATVVYHSDASHSPHEHIEELWKVLVRRTRRDRNTQHGQKRPSRRPRA